MKENKRQVYIFLKPLTNLMETTFFVWKAVDIF